MICDRCGEGFEGIVRHVVLATPGRPDTVKRICPECDVSLRRWFLGAPVRAS